MSLRSDTIRLAHDNLVLRPYLLQVLRQAREFPSQEALDAYLSEHEKAEPEKHWVRKEEPAKSDEPGAKDDAPAEEPAKKEEPKKAPSKLDGFLSRIRGVSKSMLDSVTKAPPRVKAFVAEKSSRDELTKAVAEAVRKTPKKVVDSVWAGARKEVHEIKHAGEAVKKVLRKPPQAWDKKDKKAVYAAAVYVAGAVLSAAGGGPVMAAGAVGKSFALHVAAKAMHHVIDHGFTHLEAAEWASHGAEHLLHVVEHLHLAGDEDDDLQRGLIEHLTVAVGAVLDEGVSDDDMESILKGTKEPDMNEFGQPKTEQDKEAALRTSLIRLAHANPDLRPHLLPLLTREAGDGTHVAVRALPATVQRALKQVDYGRKDIEVRAKDSVSIQGSGGDGYQDFAVVLNIETGATETHMGSWGGANPWSPQNRVDMDDRMHAIPMNGAVIKGTRGGGRPVYAVLYVNPGNMPTFLPAPVSLTPQEDMALAIISGLKPGYRAEYFTRNKLGPYDAQNPVLLSLVKKGLVRATGAGIQITTEGKNSVNHRLRP
jgi:hypothetical protein